MNRNFNSIESKHFKIIVNGDTITINQKKSDADPNSLSLSKMEFHELYTCMYAVEQEMEFNNGIH